MNTFEYSDKLLDLFLADIDTGIHWNDTSHRYEYDDGSPVATKDVPLALSVGFNGTDESIANKLRQEDVAAEEFNSDSSLPFIAFYFAGADITRNDYMNRAILRIDIYAKSYADVTAIRARIVELIHSTFDERVRAEGQRSSGINNVYKYRLEFTPLIFT